MEHLIMTSTLARTTDTLDGYARALNKPGGGFTFDPRTLRPVEAGYAVAVVLDAEQQIMGNVTREDVVSYALRHAETLLRTPGMCVGGWRDDTDGRAYLDLSRVVDTREEAAALAREYNQLAYFDLGAKVEHRV